MRRGEFIRLLGGPWSKKPMKLVAAAILCFAGVHAEAAEIRDGDTGYIANNSIWFTNESDLSVWKRVRQAFAPKDVHLSANYSRRAASVAVHFRTDQGQGY